MQNQNVYADKILAIGFMRKLLRSSEMINGKYEELKY
jgi:hypothetical protein